MRVLDEQTINERLIADFCARTGLSNLRASGRIAHMFGSVARQLGVAYNAAWAIRDSWFWGSCGESDAEARAADFLPGLCSGPDRSGHCGHRRHE